MKRVLVPIAALALILSACASSTDAADSASEATQTTDAVATTIVSTTVVSTTEAPTTTSAGQALVGPDAEEIESVYAIVFSSETTFEEKAPLIDDPSGLEDTVAKYTESGETMGGITLAATAIEVNGDTADVTYDLLFGGTPTYPDLKGDAVRVDGGWLITREMFCSIMTSARVGCPTS